MEQSWGAGPPRERLQWPADIGDELPELIAEELLEACRTFPAETGLGWDQWHPRVIERLSHSTLFLLVAGLIECEQLENGRQESHWCLSHCYQTLMEGSARLACYPPPPPASG